MNFVIPSAAAFLLSPGSSSVSASTTAVYISPETLSLLHPSGSILPQYSLPSPTYPPMRSGRLPDSQRSFPGRALP